MAKRNQNPQFFLIEKKSQTETSRQQENNVFSGISDIITPLLSPYRLQLAYSESFIIGGLVDRVAISASNGWNYIDDVSDETKKFLEKIDQENIVKNLFLFGDTYLEKIRNASGKVVDLKPFLTPEVRRKKSGEYVQWAEWIDPVIFEKEDVIHISLPSIRSRYYGESKIGRCVEQITLLALIDRYYETLFARGHLKSKIFINKEKDISTDEALGLKNIIEARLSGLDNAYSVAFIQWHLDILDLDGDVDTTAFLDYREKLIASISIALGIPLDIIDPTKASRNTKAESVAEFNDSIILPLQERIMSALITELSDDYSDIKNVQFYPSDNRSKNLETEMKVLTGYKNAGVFSVNEVREALGRDRVEGGDEFVVAVASHTEKNPQEEVEKIEKFLSEMYEK